MKISLRCSKLLAYDGVHFGKIIRKVSQSLGGNGGGHDVACGAYIRKDQKEEFFDLMNKELEGKLVLDWSFNTNLLFSILFFYIYNY